jgi:hypothetical protein
MNNTSVTIEAVKERDFESWMPLWGKYQEFYNVDPGQLLNEPGNDFQPR